MPSSATATSQELPPLTRGAHTQPLTVTLPGEGQARPGEGLLVSARAEDPSGIKSLRLRYRHLTQMEDYLTADMTRDSSTGLYRSSVQLPRLSLSSSHALAGIADYLVNRIAELLPWSMGCSSTHGLNQPTVQHDNVLSPN